MAFFFVQEEERTKAEQRMASVCVMWSLGVRESKALDEVEKHFSSLEKAFDKMEVFFFLDSNPFH